MVTGVLAWATVLGMLYPVLSKVPVDERGGCDARRELWGGVADVDGGYLVAWFH